MTRLRRSAGLAAVAAAVAAAALIASACIPPLGPVDVTLRIQPSTEIGPVNPRVASMSENAGLPLLVSDARPPFLRIDAGLESASLGPGQLDLRRLLDQLAQVRATGAEPLVILSYMPAWLSGSGTGRVLSRAPTDLTAWRELIRSVVTAVATAPAPARWFEVWNEADLEQFFSGTPQQFVDMAVASHRAVADVEAATGLDLHIGGPAVADVNSDVVPAYLDGLVRAGLRPDFVSWHRYPNQFSGPDGPEDPNQYYGGGARNPFMRPDEVAAGEDRARGLIRYYFPADGDSISTAVTEWNMSAGGLDVRNESNEGAAFSAAALIALEHRGVDLAMTYRAVGGKRPGDWGVVDLDGERTPRFDVFTRFAATTGTRRAVSGADPDTGLWARAAAEGTSGSTGELMVAAHGANPWVALDRRLRIEGLGASDVDTSLIGVGDLVARPVSATRDGDAIVVDLPAQSVLYLRWRPV